MDIFINIEVFFLLLIVIVGLVATIAIQKSNITERFPLLFYLRLTSWFLVLYYLTRIISIILNSEAFTRVNVILLFPVTFFFILFYNNISKESYYTFGLILACCLGFLLIFLGMLPNASHLEVEIGTERFVAFGFFDLINNTIYILFIGYLFMWGLKTWLSSPFYLKTKSFMCFIGTLFYIGGFILNLLYHINPIFNIFIHLSNLIGILILTLVIMRNVKILYVLPYIIYRISVRDNKGNPLYDHDWSELNIHETVFSGFLNAIEIMSEEVMHVGGILDINLNKGILIVNRSHYITIGLLASKASKLLRDCVINFANDFEKKFERYLKISCIDMDKYKSAYEFINKYFALIPYQIIKSKNQLLTLSSKYQSLPQQTKNKFKDIFCNELEYESVLNDLVKTPCSDPSEFFNLYNELQNEINQLDLKDLKKTDKDFYIE
ncbi:MAG: hypothetical protein ACFFC3_13900 [Candidatus Odinarchaeota archaeon]